MRHLLFFCLLAVCSQLHAQQNKLYYPSGLLQYNYELKDGFLDGEFFSYYENGLVRAKGSFSKNQKSGIWQAWDTSGMLRSKRYYRNDNDFDLVSEWTSNGCQLDVVRLKTRNNDLHASGSAFHDDIIYQQNYWQTLLSQPANEELFSNDFNNLLKTEIERGVVVVFADDRFVNPMPVKDALDVVNSKPDEFLLKESHSYLSFSQRMKIRPIGLGLVYKKANGDKIAWLYCPDLFSVLRDISGLPRTIPDKFNNNSFAKRMDMTTWQSQWVNPRKIAEGEIMAIKLAEIDFETTAWIYLLNKDLLVNK